jgi:hypothetical protein
MSNTTRPTLASTNARLDNLEGAITELLALAKAPQHATTTALAEQVVETPSVSVAKTAKPKPEPAPKSASDLLKEFAESVGYRFAKGGRVEMGLDELKAAARVMKTGKPEVLTIGKRVIAMGRTDDGARIFTQNLYKPEAE